jgi:hypothetical protein
MKLTTLGLAVLACAVASGPSAAQGIGSKMPVVELEGYANTPAKTYDEFMGRAVLIEFFAFW